MSQISEKSVKIQKLAREKMLQTSAKSHKSLKTNIKKEKLVKKYTKN